MKQQRDYYAFQEVWQHCVHNYLSTSDAVHRMQITDDFKNSLVDITEEGKKALKTLYDEWETKVFDEIINNELNSWIESHPHESNNQEVLESERLHIILDYNYRRYHKILQIIQDSGIGLGSGKKTAITNRRGFTGDG